MIKKIPYQRRTIVRGRPISSGTPSLIFSLLNQCATQVLIGLFYSVMVREYIVRVYIYISHIFRNGIPNIFLAQPTRDSGFDRSFLQYYGTSEYIDRFLLTSLGAVPYYYFRWKRLGERGKVWRISSDVNPEGEDGAKCPNRSHELHQEGGPHGPRRAPGEGGAEPALRRNSFFPRPGRCPEEG